MIQKGELSSNFWHKLIKYSVILPQKVSQKLINNDKYMTMLPTIYVVLTWDKGESWLRKTNIYSYAEYRGIIIVLIDWEVNRSINYKKNDLVLDMLTHELIPIIRTNYPGAKSAQDNYLITTYFMKSTLYTMIKYEESFNNNIALLRPHIYWGEQLLLHNKCSSEMNFTIFSTVEDDILTDCIRLSQYFNLHQITNRLKLSREKEYWHDNEQIFSTILENIFA